jgi:hypothetical protein
MSPKSLQKTKHRAQISSRPSTNSCFIAGWSLEDVISASYAFQLQEIKPRHENYVKETALVFVITTLILLGGTEQNREKL